MNGDEQNSIKSLILRGIAPNESQIIGLLVSLESVATERDALKSENELLRGNIFVRDALVMQFQMQLKEECDKLSRAVELLSEIGAKEATE